MWLIGPNSTSTDAKDHHATLSTTQRKVAASSFSTALRKDISDGQI